MLQKADNMIAAQQSLLLSTFRKVLRPLVKLMLRHNVTYPMVIEEIKRLYVEVADQDFKMGNKPQTDSRITLLTGVHRRDVNRFREHHSTDVVTKSNFSAEILAVWLGNPRYLDDKNQPKALPKSTKSDEVSFESLVAEVSKDIRARPVLDEWLHTKLVSLNDDQLIVLNRDAFLTSRDLEEQLSYLEMNLHDHAAAAVSNVLSDEAPFMERCVYYDQLSPEQIDHLHALTKLNGMQLLRDINQQALSLQHSADATSTLTTSMRMNVGIYFYAEQDKKNS